MKLQLAITLILATGQFGCTLPITDWSYRLASPDGHKHAIVRTRGLKPHRLELRIESLDSPRTVFTQDYSDVYVHFCELHWTPDARVIEMLVTINEGSQVVFAYDVVSKQPVTATWVTEDLRHAITTDYTLKPSDDPIQFANSFQAQVLFNERYERALRTE